MQQPDPITLEVVRGSLVSTVLQMRATLMRTAYAPILYETKDFSCGLVTADGELAAMSEDFSGHVFAMALGLTAALDKFGNEIHPGDVLASNDPYTGGTHLNDIAFYTPFFADGKPLLFIAVRAHHQDVGGATPGSFSGQDTEIYQEGVRIVPVKIKERGKLNQALWDVLFANMRLQVEREGDALAMMDTAHVAEQSISELCQKYGPDTVRACLYNSMDSAEETMRQRISELPDGVYRYEQYMDCSGLSPDPMPIKAKLTIERDTMTVDFTGSAPQVVGPMNCGIPVTMGGVFVGVKSWLDPKTPVNGGTFRPLKFVVPEGSCLAAELPAPVGGCWELYRQLESTMAGLFSQIIPENLGAEVPGGVNHIYIAGYDGLRDKPYILYDYPQGGTPATSDTDGATGIVSYDAGDIPAAQPTESIEQRQPLFIESLAASTDREGPGSRISGYGVTRRVRILSDSGQLSVMTDRGIIPPWGSGGADSGSTNSVTLIRDGEELQPSELQCKVKGFPLQKDDVVLMQVTAGGGVGDPLERDPELTRSEVRDGYITPQRARDVYGVAIDDGTVDYARTDELRRELRDRRQYVELTESPQDDFDERGCRLCALNPETAAKIEVSDGDMLEFVSGVTAPLRAWVRFSDDVPAGAVQMGPIGRGILRATPGDRIRVRKLNLMTVNTSSSS